MPLPEHLAGLHVEEDPRERRMLEPVVDRQRPGQRLKREARIDRERRGPGCPARRRTGFPPGTRHGVGCAPVPLVGASALAGRCRLLRPRRAPGQIATATTAVAPKTSSTPTMAAIRLVIGRVAEGADQPGGDHHDDQQRDPVEADRADVPVGPQPAARYRRSRRSSPRRRTRRRPGRATAGRSGDRDPIWLSRPGNRGWALWRLRVDGEHDPGHGQPEDEPADVREVGDPLAATRARPRPVPGPGRTEG